MLSDASIRELQQILKEDYGQTVSFEDAAEIGHVLTNYYELALKIVERPLGKAL